ncbi:MAG: ABC transporter ATP-binding protein [Nitrospinota bacterium]
MTHTNYSDEQQSKSEQPDPIVVKNLSRHFKSVVKGDRFIDSIKALFSRKRKLVKAVDNISFTIKDGEFAGFVGENGAGKSTTIKTLTGILTPTSGSVKIAKLIPYQEREKNSRQIGVVFGQRTQLWWDLPLKESFELLCAIFQIERIEYKQTFDELATILELHEFLDKPVRNLSLGQRMRADIAAALIHSPKILFLDEPTIGLDLVAKDRVRFFLKKINELKKTTILLTTHDMDDIEVLCSRIIILDDGKIVFDGLTQDLKNQYLHERIVDVEFLERVTQLSIDHTEIIYEQGRHVSLKIDLTKISIPETIKSLLNCYKVKDISVHAPKIADVIKKIYADPNYTRGVHRNNV